MVLASLFVKYMYASVRPPPLRLSQQRRENREAREGGRGVSRENVGRLITASVTSREQSIFEVPLLTSIACGVFSLTKSLAIETPVKKCTRTRWLNSNFITTDI